MAKTNKSAGGIGESKIHADSAAFEPKPERHVNGQPVGTGRLDHLLAGRYTDEGMAEVEAKPKARTQVVRDAFDKKTYDEYRDKRENTTEPWESVNPMEQLVKAHVPEDHKPRFLSASKVTRDGLRGWKPVIDSNGDAVKLGNMTLASMPKEKAAERNRFYRDKSGERMQEIYNNSSEQLNQKGLRAIDTAHQGNSGLTRHVGNAAALD